MAQLDKYSDLKQTHSTAKRILAGAGIVTVLTAAGCASKPFKGGVVPLDPSKTTIEPGDLVKGKPKGSHYQELPTFRPVPGQEGVYEFVGYEGEKAKFGQSAFDKRIDAVPTVQDSTRETVKTTTTGPAVETPAQPATKTITVPVKKTECVDNPVTGKCEPQTKVIGHKKKEVPDTRAVAPQGQTTTTTETTRTSTHVEKAVVTDDGPGTKALNAGTQVVGAAVQGAAGAALLEPTRINNSSRSASRSRSDSDSWAYGEGGDVCNDIDIDIRGGGKPPCKPGNGHARGNLFGKPKP